MTRLFLLIPAALLALAACDGDGKTVTSTETKVDGVTTGVAVTDAWCRPTIGDRRMTACYMTLKAGQADRLVTASSPQAKFVQVHDMSTEGGVMRMQEMADGLPLPANQDVALAPGGKHLMVMEMAAGAAAGDKISFTLTFEQAGTLEVQAEVRTAPTAH